MDEARAFVSEHKEVGLLGILAPVFGDGGAPLVPNREVVLQLLVGLLAHILHHIELDDFGEHVRIMVHHPILQLQGTLYVLLQSP